MGGINKHGSCNQTRAITTDASKQFSLAFASLMTANARLENVLLAELGGKRDEAAMVDMMQYLRASRNHLVAGRDLLKRALQVGGESQAEYREQFGDLKPASLAELWNYQLLSRCEEEVCQIGQELREDNLAPTRRFIHSVEKLIELTDAGINVFETAIRFANSADLQRALEQNELPLQAEFARLLSRWLQFMKEYLVESLLATEVVFKRNNVAALVEQ